MTRPDRPPGGRRRRLWAALVSFGLALAAALTLVATRVPAVPNGLGLLPSTVSQLQASGVTLETPQGVSNISVRQAVELAAGSQAGTEVDSAVLATVIGPRRYGLEAPGRLCWVIFLHPGAAAQEQLDAPGTIELDAVVVDARTGSVIQGFVTFQSGTPGTRVGSE